MQTAYWDHVSSPLGELVVVVDGDARVTELNLHGRAPAGKRSPSHCRDVVAQLEAYFLRERNQFELRLNPAGTAFQRSVWEALTGIPYGEVCGYGEIARRIGNPGAARAVGQANGANPIPIIIPCHRVIAADGSIGGYSGGLAIKRHLLALEREALAA